MVALLANVAGFLVWLITWSFICYRFTVGIERVITNFGIYDFLERTGKQVVKFLGRIMSTRGAIGFRIDGQDKVTYNHFDSYPSGLGEQILLDLREACISVEDMRKIARDIRLVTNDVPPTPEEIDKYKSWTNTQVRTRSFADWNCVLREAQGGIEPWFVGLDVMTDDHAFLADSLFCEWAYIVNLDEAVLEVYRGFQKTPGVGRYAMLQDSPNYYGVSLIATVPLESIPDRNNEQIAEIVHVWNRIDSEDEEVIEMAQIATGKEISK